jgi:hypothetical protein
MKIEDVSADSLMLYLVLSRFSSKLIKTLLSIKRDNNGLWSKKKELSFFYPYARVGASACRPGNAT